MDSWQVGLSLDKHGYTQTLAMTGIIEVKKFSCMSPHQSTGLRPGQGRWWSHMGNGRCIRVGQRFHAPPPHPSSFFYTNTTV